MTQINLDDALGKRASISIDPEESPGEQGLRLKNEERQARNDMWRSNILFGVIVTSILLVGGICLYEGVFDANATADTKRWAQTIVAILFSSAISFVVGQAIPKKAK